MRGMAIIVAVLMLAGCATTQVPLKSAHMIDAPRFHQTTEKVAPLSVTVDSNYGVLGCKNTIFLDGEKVVTLTSGEGSVLWTTAGPHIVSVKNPGIACPATPPAVQVYAVKGKMTGMHVGGEGYGSYIAMDAAP